MDNGASTWFSRCSFLIEERSALGLGRLTHKIQFEDWVPFPPALVFRFFSNPENLPRVMPATTHTRLDRLDLVPPPPLPDSVASPDTACASTVIVTSFRPLPFLPLRAQWIARITEFEWNHYFADIQEKGPFKLWHHRHEFLPETRNGVCGTIVRDVIEYEVGFGPLGALANSLFVARQMRRTFAQRQRTLPQLLT